MAPCPRCGTGTGQVHRYCERTLADVAADGRPVVLRVRVRRMRCPVPGCPVQTFRERVPGLLDRYQRRTTRLAGRAGEVARRLAGRAGAGLLTALGVPVSRDTALRMLLRFPCPRSACRGCWASTISRCAAATVYGTVLVDAETGERVDVLPAAQAESLEAWLRDHPGVRDHLPGRVGRLRRGGPPRAPGAVQVADRWQCAMRRLVVSPAQPGGTRREVLGSDGLPGSER